jgi:3-deoxy-7-phosphoheptulonate synthase
MLKSRRPRAGCERSAAAEATRLTGYPPPVGPDVAVAVIASESVEPEVQRFLGHLRSRNIRAAFYDVGPGVVMLLDTPVAEIESIIGGNPVIERVFIADTRYCLARREVWPTGTIVPVGGVPVGSGEFVLVAGPCAVESRSQLMETAAAVADAGASILRGGAFKPRTSPHNFQGLGLYGVDLLAEARAVYGLPFITEVMESSCIEPMYGLVDGFQVGARNMQNFELLKALGEIDRRTCR